MNNVQEPDCVSLSSDNMMSGLESTATPSADDIPATQTSAYGEDCEAARVYKKFFLAVNQFFTRSSFS